MVLTSKLRADPVVESAAAREPLPSAVDAPEITVLMPCLNEARTLAACIEQARNTLAEHSLDGEILIADNGSTDDSVKIAQRLGARVVCVPERGYGSALLGGLGAARGKYIIMADADESYDFRHLPRFVERLRAGDELVMGNRFRGGIAPGAMPALHRYLGNPVLTGIGRLLFGCPCGDFHCGMRGFRADSMAALELSTTGMEFASEMVVKATLHGLRIGEVPTTLSPDGRDRPPHLRSFRDGWRHLRFMLLFSPRWLFLYPGLSLVLVGVLLMGLLMSGPVTIGRVTFDVQTMLYAGAAMLVGFQAVLFAVLSKVFAMRSGLLPFTRGWRTLFSFVTLETGVGAGGLLFLGGLAASVFAVGMWERAGFGTLEPRATLRVVIPAVVGLVLGCQIVLSSLFLSVLGLQQR